MLAQLKRVRRTAAILALTAMTGLAAACGISQRQEVEIGRQYAAEINRELPIVEDAVVNRYVNLLGERLARQGGRDLNYRFYIVNTDAINAFALPGGFIYLNRGLIERTDNLAELAGVMAHEIGHVEERHSVEQIERMQRANIGLNLAYILLGRAPGQLERAGVNVAGQLVFANFSRDAENEADAVGVQLLVRSGIDPNGLVTFFKELLEERERQPSVIEQWFATHPLTEERIAAVRENIRRLPPSSGDLIINTDQYEAMKARLRQYREPPAEFRTRR